MLTKTLLKAPPKASNVIPVGGGAAATAKELEALISSVCAKGDWQRAATLVAGAHHLSMVPTWRTYKALLCCMARRTNWRSSVAVLNDLAAGQMSTHALYRSFAALCAEAGDGESVHHVLEEAARRGVGMPHGVYLQVAQCYADCGMHARLLELPALMARDRVPVSPELLAALLRGCAGSGGAMGEHAKMILARAGGEAAATPTMAEHYFLALSGADWELGTRQYLAMPYAVRLDGAVIAALAALVQRGGRWFVAAELVKHQLWAVKGFNNRTVDALLDARTEELAAAARAPLATPAEREAAVAEAVDLFFSRRGVTERSADVALEAILAVPAGEDPTAAQLEAASDFIRRVSSPLPNLTASSSSLAVGASSKRNMDKAASPKSAAESKGSIPPPSDAVPPISMPLPNVRFSPRALAPLLLALPFAEANALLRAALLPSPPSQRATTAGPLATLSTDKAPLASAHALTDVSEGAAAARAQDETAVAAFLTRTDVPMRAMAEFLPHAGPLERSPALLRRLAGSCADALRNRSLFGGDAAARGELPEALSLLVGRMGPHSAAAALYNVNMCRPALAILGAYVRGPDELTETIIAGERLWEEALQYAESCAPELSDDTVRNFAVRVCTVCGQWAAVERALELIGAVSDVEQLLLREARRRGREPAVAAAVAGRRFAEAARLWREFHLEEGVLRLDAALGDRIVLGLLDVDLCCDADADAVTAAAAVAGGAKGDGSSGLSAIAMGGYGALLSDAIAVAKGGAPAKDTARPCGALVSPLSSLEGASGPNAAAARMLLVAATDGLGAAEGAAAARAAVAALQSTPPEALKGTLAATGAFAAAVTTLLLVDTPRPAAVPPALAAAIGGASPAVDAALQRMAAAIADGWAAEAEAATAEHITGIVSGDAPTTPPPTTTPTVSTATPPPKRDWDRLLAIFEACGHASIPSLVRIARRALADPQCGSVTIGTALLPVILSALAAAPQSPPAQSSPPPTAEVNGGASSRSGGAVAAAAGTTDVAQLAEVAVDVAVCANNLSAAMRIYAQHPKLLDGGPAAVERFLSVCDKASGQGEEALRSVRRLRGADGVKALLRAEQPALAARFYAAHKDSMCSSPTRGDGPRGEKGGRLSIVLQPSLLHREEETTHTCKTAVPYAPTHSERSNALRAVLRALLETDAVAAAALATEERIGDVGIDMVQPLLSGLTAAGAAQRAGVPPQYVLLQAARFVEWLATEDPLLATDARLSQLLSLCVPFASPTRGAAEGNRGGEKAADSYTPAAADHRSVLLLALSALRRTAAATGHSRIVKSLETWLWIGEEAATAEGSDSIGIDALFGGGAAAAKGGAVPSASLVAALSSKKSEEGRPLMVWTPERKLRLAKHFAFLEAHAPPERAVAGGAADAPNTTAEEPPRAQASVDPFTHVAASEFSGEVSANDVKALWYGGGGGARRHIGRLSDALSRRAGRSGPAAAATATATGGGFRALGGGGHSSSSNLPEKINLMKSEAELLAQHMAVIRYGTAQEFSKLIATHFPSYNSTSLRRAAFQNSSAIRAATRDNPLLVEAAHEQLGSPLSRQLQAVLSSYCGSGADLESPSLWRAVALEVFHGAVTPAGAGWLLRRDAAVLREVAARRWSREAELEIAAAVERTGVPPSSLETDPRRSGRDIAHYYRSFRWAFLKCGSFAPSDISVIAGHVAYSRAITERQHYTRRRPNATAIERALAGCMETHSAAEVAALVAGPKGRYRLADAWHASVGSIASNAVVDVDSVNAFGADAKWQSVIVDTPLIPLASTAVDADEAAVGEDIAEFGYGPVNGLPSARRAAAACGGEAAAVARRLARHEAKARGYLTFRTAKAVLSAAPDGDEALEAARLWLADQGFKVSFEDARRIRASAVASAARRNDEASGAWLRSLRHLPSLYGACTILHNSAKASSSSFSRGSTNRSSPASEAAAKAVGTELIRLAKSRTSRREAKEAWSLLLRRGMDKALPPEVRLDIAVAMAGI